MTRSPYPSGKLLLTPLEAAGMLSVSRSKLYELIALGRLASVKLGGSRRIPVHAVESFVAELLADGESKAQAG